MDRERQTMKQLLDEVAAASWAKSTEELWADLREVEPDPESRIARLQQIISKQVADHRQSVLDSLLGPLPESAAELRALLGQLEKIFGVEESGLIGAFREAKDLSASDLKVMIENLLSLHREKRK